MYLHSQYVHFRCMVCVKQDTTLDKHAKCEYMMQIFLILISEKMKSTKH